MAFKLEDTCNRILETAEHSKATQAADGLGCCLEALTGCLGGKGGEKHWWQWPPVPIAAGTLDGMYSCVYFSLQVIKHETLHQ